jgi:hypothetical protein
MTASDKQDVVEGPAQRPVVSDRGRGLLRGIGLGGILVILGIILALTWSVWVGLILVLIGLVAFGGFVKGKWY